MEYFGISDVGLVRSSNQDRFFVHEKANHDIIAIVCDGIGGGKAGDVASENTVRALERAWQSVSAFANMQELEGWMYQQIRGVNDEIFTMAITSEQYQGMGTTLVGCVLHKQECRIMHVGDSRAYCLQDDRFSCLTEDHSYMNELMKRGELTLSEATKHPKRNYLTNAIGVYNQIRIDVIAVPSDFEVLLFCSDGLHGVVSNEKIQIIMRQPWSAKEKCEMLVSTAKQFGGIDNITAIVMQKEANE